MNTHKGFSVPSAWRIPVLALISAAAIPAVSANPAADRMFGQGSPFTLDQLPPGQLRSGLQQLPPQAKSKALHWLHSFSFPAEDAQQLQVDAEGGVFYIDAGSSNTDAASASSEPSTSQLSASEVFTLHSKPGAATTLYVDVDGHVITGTAWNQGTADPLYAQPFDSDGNSASFSANELDQIAEMWHRIAEDFAAFDVDVTTEQPSSFGPTVGRILITPNVDANGVDMPAVNAGGVAYVNVFGRSDYGYYSPALVYSNNLSNFPPFIAEAASHEAGHNLGLSHDGTSSLGYYSGHGSGATSWGPIMGTGYNDNVSQWDNGSYADANNFQDDIAIMAGKMGLRLDDHGDTLASASLLQVEADGSIVSTTPQNDPFNNNTVNKGIIGSSSDQDLFTFNTAGGDATITVTPSWAAWLRTSNGRGTNLDVELTLLDGSGAVLAQVDPLNETNAVLSTTLAAGDYYLVITGVGNSLSPYPDYGSQGQYFISGSIQPSVPDTEAPTPNPMGWSSVPTASGATSIAMTAVTATDNRSSVQYYFACVAGGNGCSDSGWTTSPSYSATGLSANSSYSWQVKARDSSGNETVYSATASATTDDVPQPPTAVSGFSATDNQDGSATLNWQLSANASSYQVVRESWHAKRRRWRSTTLLATLSGSANSYQDASGTGLYRYYVRAINEIGSADSAWAEVTVTSASGGGGGGGGGGCKGGPKKCP